MNDFEIILLHLEDVQLNSYLYEGTQTIEYKKIILTLQSKSYKLYIKYYELLYLNHILIVFL